MKPLDGQIAIVTSASRGVGKGIALGLGKAGTIVYLAGQTVCVLAAAELAREYGFTDTDGTQPQSLRGSD